MKKRTGKLILNRETVRLLTMVEPSLQRVNGGLTNDFLCYWTDTCVTECYACDQPSPSLGDTASWCICQ